MRQPSLRRARLTVAVAALVGAVVPAACNLFATDHQEIWVCLNATTGKEDPNTYDATHYVNGVFDPCNCYDPCGPAKTCPNVIDAGPPPPDAMCEAGDDSDAGDAGGW